MLEKLEAIHDRWRNVSEKLSDPEVVKDMKKFMQFNKEYKDLTVIVDFYKEYKLVLQNLEESKLILKEESDVELREMAKEELETLSVRKEQMDEEIKVLLIPKDPEDDKNCILEIRGGTGGDEAALFAGDLFRMYTKFAEGKKWKLEIVSTNEGTAGGYKEIIANITGQDVYGTLKYESGVHRVQRVPATESQGRVHTSAATVAILPEAD
ncbi:MAG: peptide chain release factor 1, partial [Limisphaerales bacterium]